MGGCRIVLLSDIHVGRLLSPRITSQMLEAVHATRPDLVVVAGDLVQRAHRYQYRRAKALMASIEPPVLVIPGNHDLYSWIWRPWMRMTNPLGRYRRMIGRDYASKWRGQGVAVLGIDTATAWTIQRGRCLPRHGRQIQEFFAAIPAGTRRVLALHHPPSHVSMPGGRDVAKRADIVMEAARRARIDLILSGHWHLPWAGVVHSSSHSVVMALAGTATSDRYREPCIDINSFGVVDIEAKQVTVTEMRYARSMEVFAAFARRSFPLT